MHIVQNERFTFEIDSENARLNRQSFEKKCFHLLLVYTLIHMMLVTNEGLQDFNGLMIQFAMKRGSLIINHCDLSFSNLFYSFLMSESSSSHQGKFNYQFFWSAWHVADMFCVWLVFQHKWQCRVWISGPFLPRSEHICAIALLSTWYVISLAFHAA